MNLSVRHASINTASVLAFAISSISSASPALAQCDTWTLRSPTDHPAGGTYHTIAYDSNRGVTVVFSGVNGAPNNETWEWDGTNWTQRTPVTTPLPRHTSAMVYDSARHVCVVFGGSAFDPSTGQYDSSETWEWDGTNWTQRSPTNSPPGRYLHAMAYDSSRQVTVLFGGFQSGGSGNIGDTWEYDGTDWTQRSPATSPDARDGHAMTFDSARGVTVLHAGQTFVTSSDTWEWDGSDWTQRTPTHHPVARRDHAMAYDSVRGVTILFGGELTNPLRPSGETWKWDGDDWTELTPATSPSARDGASMAYDSTRHFMVLFGGNNMGDLSSTWELSGVVGTASIDPQPQPANRCPGQTANFFIAATGTNLSYQWQLSTDGGATFNDVTNGTGGTTVSYTTPVLSPTDNGNKYRCAVSVDCGSTKSTAADLTVNANTAINVQPVNATAVIQPAAAAPTATFTVVAAGANLSFQWQKSTDNGEIFSNVTTGTGGNTATYHTAGLSLNDTGTKYNCVVTGICGQPQTSNLATLTVQDASGVSNAVEDGAPNGGDGNSDGIPDRLQENVTSLPNSNDDYVTLVSPSGTTLGSVVSQGNPSPSDTPAGAQFPAGFLKFNVNNVSVGGATTVQIILPPGVNVNAYWKFGPEPGNSTPHWYNFTFDGTTGAQFSNNLITLNFVDGARGDSDLTANGVISDPGAPAIQASAGDSPTPTVQATPGCGTCGAGATMMMPLAFICWIAVRTRSMRRTHHNA